MKYTLNQPETGRQCRRPASRILCAMIFLLGCSVASAQQWQYVYGPTSSGEVGQKRVAPVLGNCTSPANGGVDGYIAVGSSDNKVYVIRTKNDGSTSWERTYDIRNDGLEDEGWAIVELNDGSGFAVTGSSSDLTTGGYDVFILKIDCGGNVVWSRTYGAFGSADRGYDIIETNTTGNPNQTPIPTSAGDLVVAGESIYAGAGGLPMMDGYLVRVTSTGVLIWDQLYDNNNGQQSFDDTFFGLTEASAINPSNTGDIVAVGKTDMVTLRQQGYVVRVNGDNGTFGGTPQRNAATFGTGFLLDACSGPEPKVWNEGDEVFLSVIELQNPAARNGFIRNIQIVGFTSQYGNRNIYGVQLLGGSPCGSKIETILGDPNISECGGANFEAWDVKEVHWEMSGSLVSQWDLAIVGYTDEFSLNPNSDDMLLVTVSSGFLPNGGIQKAYGSQLSGDHEYGRSLNLVESGSGRTEGFILCGENYADPVGVGDVGDAYLVKTNSSGVSGTCERDVPIVQTSMNSQVCVTPERTSWGASQTVTTVGTSLESDDEICVFTKWNLFDRGGEETGSDAGSGIDVSTPSFDNGRLHVQVDGTNSAEVEYQLFDLAGRELESGVTTVAGRQVQIDLGHRSSGVYTLVVRDNNRVGVLTFPLVW